MYVSQSWYVFTVFVMSTTTIVRIRASSTICRIPEREYGVVRDVGSCLPKMVLNSAWRDVDSTDDEATERVLYREVWKVGDCTQYRHGKGR